MQFNLIFDSSVSNAPAAFITAMEAAAQFLDTLITNPITVNVDVGYGEFNGQPIDPGQTNSDFFVTGGKLVSYDQLKALLEANETSPANAIALDSLPASDPTGGTKFLVTSAQEKAWGLLPANGSELDGAIGFTSSANYWNYDPNNPVVGMTDFVGTAERELTHVLGRDLQFNGGTKYGTLDLFKYSSPGQLNFTPGSTAYFSTDNGATNLANFDTKYIGGDFDKSLLADSFSANGYYYKPFTSVDAAAVNAVGFSIGTFLSFLSNEDLVSEVYIGYYNRSPDQGGMSFWLNSMANGATLTQVADAFANSSESIAVYPFLSNPNLANASSFVTQVYNNLLNRAPEDAGLQFWSQELQSGAVTPGSFILAIEQSVNQQTGTADAMTLGNKLTVAVDYVTRINAANVPASEASAHGSLAAVTSDASTISAGEAVTTAYIGITPPLSSALALFV